MPGHHLPMQMLPNPACPPLFSWLKFCPGTLMAAPVLVKAAAGRQQRNLCSCSILTEAERGWRSKATLAVETKVPEGLPSAALACYLVSRTYVGTLSQQTKTEQGSLTPVLCWWPVLLKPCPALVLPRCSGTARILRELSVGSVLEVSHSTAALFRLFPPHLLPYLGLCSGCICLSGCPVQLSAPSWDLPSQTLALRVVTSDAGDAGGSWLVP